MARLSAHVRVRRAACGTCTCACVCLGALTCVSVCEPRVLVGKSLIAMTAAFARSGAWCSTYVLTSHVVCVCARLLLVAVCVCRLLFVVRRT